ncbi:alpha/beta hydrolase [Gordonia sp. (in: high G+C Gram-positive bacteria)]|uniref:alpha/beta fold hydrolase n=1 Tax=Gordonia sp. (in: high G+C Gram-positive bacteria) TaxID=84139 RepID=UPI00169CEDEB|nr:alpha/beta hydrolase [Gordonia sp. (in: high G+C Gram-positive bacteria)]NLG47358.1 alpha/beta hydrolase [Gordonia sp. (in: high G+C Gram-positive bacteria)]
MVSVEDQSPPQWFRDALAQSGQPGRVDVNGASIAYRSWGEPDTPGVVLIHGGMANQNWWDHIAPFLASGRRVVTLDLAGHGDSDRRSEYRFEEFIDEVLAVASAGRIAGPPILVGHSMGGIVAYAASARCPEQIAGVIVFDSPVRDMTPEERAMRADITAHPPRIYPTVEAAVARYRLVPAQNYAEPYILEHVGRQSLREVDGGWGRKFDQNRMGRSNSRQLEGTVAGTAVAYFRSENGIVDDDLLDRMRPMLGPDAWVIDLPEAGHHPMFDQPIAMITGIRTVLAAWRR